MRFEIILLLSRVSNLVLCIYITYILYVGLSSNSCRKSYWENTWTAIRRAEATGIVRKVKIIREKKTGIVSTS